MSRTLLLSMVVFLGQSACKSDKTTAVNTNQTNAVTQVETFVVQSQTLDNFLTTNGSILPNEEVELRSEIEGTIRKINFEEGTRVRQGQILVQIDDSELQPNIQKLQAQLETAREEYSRKKQLIDIEGISQEEFEVAQLKVTTLQSDIQLVEARLRKSKITAPFDGIIGLRKVSQGAFVSVGNDIAKLVQSDPVKIEFSVPELHAGKITVGTEVHFTLTGSDKVYKATVFATEPVLDPDTRSLRIRAKADNKKGELIPGSYAELTINLAPIENGLLVPALSVTQDIKGLKLYVINDGIAAARYVRTGIQKDEFVQIIDGVNQGDTVITTSLLSMQEGMLVEAKPDQVNNAAIQ
jgi:membrane fusion protein (multidrug efflux system)